MATVGDVLMIISKQGRTGMLCFKLSGAAHLLNVYFSEGIIRAAAYGRQRGKEALDHLMSGVVESCHFVPNLSGRHDDMIPSIESISSATAHIPIRSVDPKLLEMLSSLQKSVSRNDTSLAANQHVAEEEDDDQDTKRQQKGIVPTLPPNLPWE
jgi:hypothetical protein